MSLSILFLIILLAAMGSLIWFVEIRVPPGTRESKAPRHLESRRPEEPAPFHHTQVPGADPLVPLSIGIGALAGGVIIGVLTWAFVKKGFGDCYYVGELNFRTNCVDPLAYYYAPLGLALLLITVGAVQLVTTAINKR